MKVMYQVGFVFSAVFSADLVTCVCDLTGLSPHKTEDSHRLMEFGLNPYHALVLEFRACLVSIRQTF